MTNEWTKTMYQVNDLIITEAIEKIKRIYLETGTLLKGADVYKELGEQVVKAVKETLRDLGFESSLVIDREVEDWGLELEFDEVEAERE